MFIQQYQEFKRKKQFKPLKINQLPKCQTEKINQKKQKQKKLKKKKGCAAPPPPPSSQHAVNQSVAKFIFSVFYPVPAR